MCGKKKNVIAVLHFGCFVFSTKIEKSCMYIYFKRICIVQRISVSRENKTNIETIRAVDISMNVGKTFYFLYR